MKISFLIEKLQNALKTYGDVDVKVRNSAGDFDIAGYTGFSCSSESKECTLIIDVFEYGELGELSMLSKAQLEILKHAVGWPKNYRNCFTTIEGSTKHKECLGLEKEGLLERKLSDTHFKVTEKGLWWLKYIEHKMTGEEQTKAPSKWAVGKSVIINDYSEAHGDKGKILSVPDTGIILVELEQGCIWPVTADELKPNFSICKREEEK